MPSEIVKNCYVGLRPALNRLPAQNSLIPVSGSGRTRITIFFIFSIFLDGLTPLSLFCPFFGFDTQITLKSDTIINQMLAAEKSEKCGKLAKIFFSAAAKFDGKKS